jgi:hypothetical protein
MSNAPARMRSSANQIRLWLRQIGASPEQCLFPNRFGGPMTRTGVTDRLNLADQAAATHCAGVQGTAHLTPPGSTLCALRDYVG